MKLQTGLLTVLMAAGIAWGQSSPAPAPATTSNAAQTSGSATTTKKHSSTKRHTAAAKPAGENVARNVATEKKHLGPGKRDPFISPVRLNQNEPINCGTGKRCLVVDQTILQGIVKAPNGMIAVVSNPANKAYFLRENDPVYKGFVMRITPDSVVFREQVTDKLGKTYSREVVKKITTPAV